MNSSSCRPTFPRNSTLRKIQSPLSCASHKKKRNPYSTNSMAPPMGRSSCSAPTPQSSSQEETLGKPHDAADAARMLRLLSGRTHQVITGVCLISRNQTEVAAETTAVTMREISDERLPATSPPASQ